MTDLNALAERLERRGAQLQYGPIADDLRQAAQAIRGMGDYLPEVPSQAMLDEIALAGDHAVLSGQIYPEMDSAGLIYSAVRHQARSALKGGGLE